MFRLGCLCGVRRFLPCPGLAVWLVYGGRSAKSLAGSRPLKAALSQGRSFSGSLFNTRPFIEIAAESISPSDLTFSVLSWLSGSRPHYEPPGP